MTDEKFLTTALGIQIGSTESILKFFIKVTLVNSEQANVITAMETRFTATTQL